MQSIYSADLSIGNTATLELHNDESNQSNHVYLCQSEPPHNVINKKYWQANLYFLDDFKVVQTLSHTRNAHFIHTQHLRVFFINHVFMNPVMSWISKEDEMISWHQHFP